MEPTPSPASAPVQRTKRKRVQPAPVSPPATPGQTRGSGSGADPILLLSSPVIADEEEDVHSLIDSFFPPRAITEMFVQDSSVEWVKKIIVEVEAGLAVLKTQVNHPRDAKLFLNSMRAQNIGKDIAAMATDIIFQVLSLLLNYLQFLFPCPTWLFRCDGQMPKKKASLAPTYPAKYDVDAVI
ncbi:hypothetical protein B0H14DRAFT_2588508 [Mycena olivaceomarginata]|nr:hypothetical protein B0H14DRAFT_2588508 [Mycena olivaceomarginata]